MRVKTRTNLKKRIILAGICWLLAACNSGESTLPTETPILYSPTDPGVVVASTDTPTPTLASFDVLIPTNTVIGLPTPDIIRPTPILRTEEEVYIVQPGDSLNRIAWQFQVSGRQITVANQIQNPDFLAIGQVLTIPVPIPRPAGPSFKIIPDSELVNGPASAQYDLHADVAQRGGYLSSYVGDAEGREMSGSEIVQVVAQRYSVNPRLLLAVLEQQSGWVTQPTAVQGTLPYPIGYSTYTWEGLFSQLSWAADQLNTGYYQWRAGWSGPFLLADGSIVNPGPGINAGTAGVQFLFSQLYSEGDWRDVAGEGGFYQTYLSMFGNPFKLAIEPLIPAGLQQPGLQLPFELEKVWSFTGGPHSAWGDGAAWAALDFAPPGYALGCVLSDEWVVAMADGYVLRAEEGEVLIDLDGDGFEQTGWVLFYMHIEERDRVEPGMWMRAGERIGHPSCEGGVTNGTHLHMARKYHGEWISADASLPFIMDGWTSSGLGQAYNGELTRGDVSLEAWAGRGPFNQISR